MNWNIIKGNWEQFKGDARAKWGELTDDEVDEAAGERDKLIGLVQERYGMAKSDAEHEVDKFVANLKSAA